MAKKGSAAGQSMSSKRGSSDKTDVSKLAEELQGDQTIARSHLTIGRVSAALSLWSLAYTSASRRTEIVKAGCPVYLLSLAESNEQDTRLVALGCLDALLAGEGARAMVFTQERAPRLIAHLARVLVDPHDRSRVHAASLLAAASEEPDFLHYVAQQIEHLIKGVCMPDPGFKVRHDSACGFACLTLARLSEHESSGELPYRASFLQQGALEASAHAVQMPGAASSETHEVHWRRANAMRVLASLVLEPSGPARMFALGAKPIEAIVQMGYSDDGSTIVNSAKCLHRIASESPEARDLLGEKGAVGAAINVLLRAANDTATSSKKKKSIKSKSSGHSSFEAQPFGKSEQLHAARNAAGALRHLSCNENLRAYMLINEVIEPLLGFVDPRASNKKKIKAKKKQPRDWETFLHASGCLVNLAMDPEGSEMLRAAGAPKYLCAPVHDAWVTHRSLDELTA